jgi:demethylmenaquinone methyltransferase/2-methoxy-6-polyprenyl-1,4-benzoquinol methylase
MSLRSALEGPDSKARYVRRLFATIADRYDLITVLLSYGQDARWKRRLIARAEPLTGTRVLDLACGTGDLAFLAADAGAHVTALDLTPRMIGLALQKRTRGETSASRRGTGAEASALRLEDRQRVSFVVGDMTALPLADRSFDVVTTGYGLRNVPDLDGAIGEISRVLVPGGRLLSLDFNRPSSSIVRAAYHAYLSVVGGALGWLLHRDPDTYRYIPESLRRYPDAGGVSERLMAAGFVRARWHRVLGGLLAIHEAER